jgi:hypothetical protein
LFHIQTADRFGTSVPKEDVMSGGHSPRAAEALAPSLEVIVKALEEHHAETGDRPGESNALRALGALALKHVPARGVFAPIESELDSAIDDIANRHLRFKKPRKEFFDATADVEPFAKRDEIETAANQLRSVSDRAQFYAGLAFGVTLVEFRAIR